MTDHARPTARDEEKRGNVTPVVVAAIVLGVVLVAVFVLGYFR